MRIALLPLSLLAAFVARPAFAQIVFDDKDNPITPTTSPRPAAAPREPASRRSVTPIYPNAIPVSAPPTPVAVTVRPSINPLKASATALCRLGNRLYLGLRDGGMAFCDASDGKHGTAVRFVPPVSPVPPTSLVSPVAPIQPPTAAVAPIIDPVRAIAAGHDGIYWVSSDGAQVFRYNDRDRSVVSYTVGAPGGWVQRVALLDDTVYLFGDSITRILDPSTGALRIPNDSDLPLDALPTDGRANLYLAPSDRDDAASLLAVVADDGSTPRLWRSTRAQRRHREEAREWHEVAPVADVSGDSIAGTQDFGTLRPTLAGLRSPLLPGRLTGSVAVAAEGCILPQSSGLCWIQPNADREALTSIPFGHNPGMPTSLERCTVGGSGVWWQMRGVLFRASADGMENSAYLPWNSARGAQIQTLLADKDGVYVALDRGGVRHITLDSPTLTDGYAGFVRTRLGDATMLPRSTDEASIAAAIEDWQGVPYKWGGGTKAGTDCSGFVGAMHRVVGVDIPRSTAQMAASKQGARVLDEIRYGDVLVYPGHCALYIGNGMTAETIATAVGKASIWHRTDVQVRRYLRE